MKLLDFVALYGFILAPMGAIIVFQHFFGEKWNLIIDYAENQKIQFNYAVLWSWLVAAVGGYIISQELEIFLSFLTLPVWIVCGVFFLFFSKKSRVK
jgi:hypothetical protein